MLQPKPNLHCQFSCYRVTSRCLLSFFTPIVFSRKPHHGYAAVVPLTKRGTPRATEDGFSDNCLFSSEILRFIELSMLKCLPSLSSVRDFATFWGQSKADGRFGQLITANRSLFSPVYSFDYLATMARRWIVGCFQRWAPAFVSRSGTLLSYQFPFLGNWSWEPRTPSSWLRAWMGHMRILESSGSLSNRR